MVKHFSEKFRPFRAEDFPSLPKIARESAAKDANYRLIEWLSKTGVMTDFTFPGNKRFKGVMIKSNLLELPDPPKKPELVEKKPLSSQERLRLAMERFVLSSKDGF